MPNELRRRLAITVAAIVAARVLVHIPLPLLDAPAWRRMFDSSWLSASPPGAIGTPGLVPYLNAVGLLSVWRALRGRSEDPVRERTVLALALALAVLHGIAYGSFFGNLDTGRPAPHLVSHPGGWFWLTSAVSCAAGTMISVWLATLISVRGIGNGLCLLIGTNLLCRLLDDIQTRLGSAAKAAAPPASDGAWAAAAVVSAAWIVAGVILFGARWDAGGLIRAPRAQAPRRVTLAVAGIGVVAMMVGYALLGLPSVFVWYFQPASPAARALQSFGPANVFYQGAFVIVAFLVTAMFTAWAYDPRAFERALVRRLGPPENGAWLDESGYDTKLERVLLPIALLVPLAAVASTSASAALGVEALAPFTLLRLAAVVLDTRSQWLVHRRMAVPPDAAPDSAELVRCPECGAWSGAEQEFCPACGTEWSDHARCERHGDAVGEARCVVCQRRLCAECRWTHLGRSLCQDHSGVELIEGWACVATRATMVEAGLDRQRLEEHGLHPALLTNTVAPAYGTAGLFEVTRSVPFLGHVECAGGGIRVLVRPVDHDRAAALLASRDPASASG